MLLKASNVQDAMPELAKMLNGRGYPACLMRLARVRCKMLALCLGKW